MKKENILVSIILILALGMAFKHWNDDKLLMKHLIIIIALEFPIQIIYEQYKKRQ